MKRSAYKAGGNFTDLLIALGRDATKQDKSGELLLSYGLRPPATLSAAVREQCADDDEDSGSGTSSASRDLTPMKRKRRLRI
jgi:hypothetical protein